MKIFGAQSVFLSIVATSAVYSDKGVKVFDTTDFIKCVVLAKHNEIRDAVSARQCGQQPAAHLGHLKWNQSLADMAAEHALKCTHQHNKEKLMKNHMVVIGENLGFGSRYSTQEFDEDFVAAKIAETIQNWADEHENYIFGQSIGRDTSRPITHYTQLVWEETTAVGCAVSNCPYKSYPLAYYVVCNYYKGGNNGCTENCVDGDFVPYKKTGPPGQLTSCGKQIIKSILECTGKDTIVEYDDVEAEREIIFEDENETEYENRLLKDDEHKGEEDGLRRWGQNKQDEWLEENEHTDDESRSKRSDQNERGCVVKNPHLDNNTWLTNGATYIVKQDFRSRGNKEMTIQQCERLTNCVELNRDWWSCTKENGEEGWVPRQYLEQA